MLDTKLQEYIRQSRDLGISDAEIKNTLLENGWQATDVEENFKTPSLSSLWRSAPLVFSVLLLSTLVYGSTAYFGDFWPFQDERMLQQEVEPLPGATDVPEMEQTPESSNVAPAASVTVSPGPATPRPKPSQGVVSLTPWPPGEKFGHVGEILISFSVTGETFRGVLLNVCGSVFSITGAGPYQWKINMADLDDEMGRCDIDVLTVSYDPTKQGYEASTHIFRLPEGGVTDLWVYEAGAEILVFKGEYGTRLRVRGQVIDGTEVGLTHSSAGTTYKTGSGNNSIISVSADGLVTGNSIGSDTVVITNIYARKSITVPVVVEEF